MTTASNHETGLETSPGPLCTHNTTITATFLHPKDGACLREQVEAVAKGPLAGEKPSAVCPLDELGCPYGLDPWGKRVIDLD